MKHLHYLRYLLAHKWWVAYAAVKMGLTPWEWPGLWWRLLVHDLSKFRPSEWLPYAESFYGGYEWKERPSELKAAFDRAWSLHQHRNDHHWQHWCLLEDSGDLKLLEMSANAEMEMLCDWAGAGRAISGGWDLATWYDKNREVISLAPGTRRVVDGFIDRFWRRE